MKKVNIKKYEAPLAKVTCLKTEDVIMSSPSKDLSAIDNVKLMDKGQVNWIDIQ